LRNGFTRKHIRSERKTYGKISVTADQIMTTLYSAEGMNTFPVSNWVAVADRESGNETQPSATLCPSVQQYVQEQHETQTYAHKRKAQQDSSGSLMLAMAVTPDNSKKRIRIEKRVSNADSKLIIRGTKIHEDGHPEIYPITLLDGVILDPHPVKPANIACKDENGER
jgi:hypothetical protein